MLADLTAWTIPIGMGLLLLTPSVVLIGFLLFRHPPQPQPRPRREPRGFPVVQIDRSDPADRKDHPGAGSSGDQ
jgi:hypothetical protein